MNTNHFIQQFKNREFLFIPITLAILFAFIFPQLAKGQAISKEIGKTCEDAKQCSDFQRMLQGGAQLKIGFNPRLSKRPNLIVSPILKEMATKKKTKESKAEATQRLGSLYLGNKSIRQDLPPVELCDPIFGRGCWDFVGGMELTEEGFRLLIEEGKFPKGFFKARFGKPPKTEIPKKSDGEDGSEQKDDKKDDKESGVKFAGRPTSKGGCGSVSIPLAGRLEVCGEFEFPKLDPKNLGQSFNDLSLSKFSNKGVTIGHEFKIGPNATLNSNLALFRYKKPVLNLAYQQTFSTGKEFLCGLPLVGMTDYCRRATTYVVIQEKEPEPKTDLVVDIKPGSKTTPPKTAPPKSEPEPPTTGVEDIFEIGSWEVSAAWGKNEQICGKYFETRNVQFSRVGKGETFIGTTEAGKFTILRASTTAPWRIHMNNEFIIVTNSRLIKRPLKFVGNITIKASTCKDVIGTFEAKQTLTNLPKPEPKVE